MIMRFLHTRPYVVIPVVIFIFATALTVVSYWAGF